jgi:hypothetical protein
MAADSRLSPSAFGLSVVSERSMANNEIATEFSEHAERVEAGPPCATGSASADFVVSSWYALKNHIDTT